MKIYKATGFIAKMDSLIIGNDSDSRLWGAISKRPVSAADCDDVAPVYINIFKSFFGYILEEKIQPQVIWLGVMQRSPTIIDINGEQ